MQVVYSKRVMLSMPQLFPTNCSPLPRVPIKRKYSNQFFQSMSTTQKISFDQSAPSHRLDCHRGAVHHHSLTASLSSQATLFLLTLLLIDNRHSCPTYRHSLLDGVLNQPLKTIVLKLLESTPIYSLPSRTPRMILN